MPALKRPTLALDVNIVADNVPQMVVPQVYIGSIHSSFNQEALTSSGITHILNASRLPATFPKHFTYLSIDLRDKEDANILACIPASNIFVEAGITAGGVLIHCFGGRSRSAAFVAAFLMSSRGLDFDRAMAVITAVRPVASVNKGFERQLRAYGQVGYDVYAAQQVLLRNRIRGLHELRGTWRKPSRSFRPPRDGSRRNNSNSSNESHSMEGLPHMDRRQSDSFTSHPHGMHLVAAAGNNGKGHKRYRPRLGLATTPSAGAHPGDTLVDPDDEEDDEDEEYDECGNEGGCGGGDEAKDAPGPEARVTLTVPRLHASASAPAHVGDAPPALVAYVDPKAPRCRLSRPGSTAVRVIPPLRGLERGFCCSFCGGGLFCLANVLRVGYSPPFTAPSSSSNSSGSANGSEDKWAGRAPLHTSRAKGGGAKAFDFDFPAPSRGDDDYCVAPGKGSPRGPPADTTGGLSPSSSAKGGPPSAAADEMDVDAAADHSPGPARLSSGDGGGGPSAMDLDDDPGGGGGDLKAASATALDAKRYIDAAETPRLPLPQREMLTHRHASLQERRPESAEKRRWLARMSLLASAAAPRPSSGSDRGGTGSDRSPLFLGRPRSGNGTSSSGAGGSLPQGVASPRLSGASQTLALSTGRPRSSSSSAPAQLAAGVAKMARDDDEALRLACGVDSFAHAFDLDDAAGAAVDAPCLDGAAAAGLDQYLYVEYLDWMDPDGAILGTAEHDRDVKPSPGGNGTSVSASPPDPRGMGQRDGMTSSSSSSPASPPLTGDADKDSGDIRCRHCRREIGSWTWRPSARQCLGGRLEAPLFRVHRGVVHLADVPLDATPLGTPRLAEPDGRPATPKAPAKDDGGADNAGRRGSFASK